MTDLNKISSILSEISKSGAIDCTFCKLTDVCRLPGGLQKIAKSKAEVTFAVTDGLKVAVVDRKAIANALILNGYMRVDYTVVGYLTELEDAL